MHPKERKKKIPVKKRFRFKRSPSGYKMLK